MYSPISVVAICTVKIWSTRRIGVSKCLFCSLGVLNKDGVCKCFDENADGYTRSEAIVILVLQKKKDARRFYAQVILRR